jgi:hypothetical protein
MSKKNPIVGFTMGFDFFSFSNCVRQNLLQQANAEEEVSELIS